MDEFKIRLTKPILQLAPPVITRGSAHYDYGESRILTKQPKRFPEWDRARNSVTMEVVKWQKELERASELLVKRREQSKVGFKKCDKDWMKLFDDENTLRESFQRFHQFALENEEKRTRAIHKIIYDAELIEARIEIVDALRNKNIRLIEYKIEMEQAVKDFKLYEDFMISVARMPNTTFSGVNGVLMRYQELIFAKEEITKHKQHEIEGLENAKKVLIKLVDDNRRIILNLKNRMVDMIKRHGNAKRKTLLWENIVFTIRHEMIAKQTDIEAVKVGTLNVYRDICHRIIMKPKLAPEQFVEQLVFISDYLFVLKKMSKKIRKEMEKIKQTEVQTVIYPKRNVGLSYPNKTPTGKRNSPQGSLYSRHSQQSHISKRSRPSKQSQSGGASMDPRQSQHSCRSLKSLTFSVHAKDVPSKEILVINSE